MAQVAHEGIAVKVLKNHWILKIYFKIIIQCAWIFSNVFIFEFYCVKTKTKLDTKLAKAHSYAARETPVITCALAGVQREFERRANFIE